MIAWLLECAIDKSVSSIVGRRGRSEPRNRRMSPVLRCFCRIGLWLRWVVSPLRRSGGALLIVFLSASRSTAAGYWANTQISKKNVCFRILTELTLESKSLSCYQARAGLCSTRTHRSCQPLVWWSDWEECCFLQCTYSEVKEQSVKDGAILIYEQWPKIIVPTLYLGGLSRVGYLGSWCSNLSQSSKTRICPELLCWG